MDELRFEWDPAKDTGNQEKRGVSFDEAKTAFFDDFARVIADPEHSDLEERLILLGMSIKLKSWSSATATLRKRTSFVSSLLEKRTHLKGRNTRITCHEKALRFVEVQTQPLYREGQTPGDDSAR